MIINPHIGSNRIDNNAKLYSLGITGSVCMKFYFFLYGNETGQLKIWVWNRVVFYRYGNHGHKWNFAQVYLEYAPTVAYQVMHSKLA